MNNEKEWNEFLNDSINPPALLVRDEQAEVGMVKRNASYGKMIKVSQTEIKTIGGGPKWTIPVYHTRSGNASTISYSSQSIEGKRCMAR